MLSIEILDRSSVERVSHPSAQLSLALQKDLDMLPRFLWVYLQCSRKGNRICQAVDEQKHVGRTEV